MSGDFEEIIAPGAFANQVGRVVPFTIADHKPIGTAKVLDDGRIEITITDPVFAQKFNFITGVVS